MTSNPVRLVRDELDRLSAAEKRAPADKPKDAWAFLVAAIELGATNLSTINLLCGNGNEQVDAVPFVLVAYDALIPRRAHELDEKMLSDVIKAWQPVPRGASASDRRDAAQRKKDSWKSLRKLAKAVVDHETMQRKWGKISSAFTPDPACLIDRVTEYVAQTKTRISFVPDVDSELIWVRLMRHWIRSAPRLRDRPETRSKSPKHQRSESASELPETFLRALDAEKIIPETRAGARGPKPVSDVVVLKRIFDKFRSDRGWKSISEGSTIHRRFNLWRSQGILDRLRSLAVEHGVLTAIEAERMK